MVLSGLQVYKQLPQTDCKDCGYPTCLAFAMKLAARQTGVATCPHLSNETKEFLRSKLSEHPEKEAVTEKSKKQLTPSEDIKLSRPLGKLFVCYSRKDEKFALELAQKLKNKGVDIWIDRWNIPIGSDWDRCIEDALFECNALLIILSPDSCNSNEVRGELRTALDEKKVIIPVIFRDCKIPRQLRLVQYFDFTTESANKEFLIDQIIDTFCSNKV